MLLESGAYFGEVRIAATVNDANIAVTDYCPQEQPWHTHENPTFFVHLRGHHLDCLNTATLEQPLLSIVYHPSSARHRSYVGPDGMTGLNIELTREWLDAHHISEAELGRERLLQQGDSQCAALRLVEATMAGCGIDSENSLLDLTATLLNAPSEGTPNWLRRAIGFADAHVAEGLTVREVAAEIGVHPVHLTRAFRKVSGSTFTTYLQKGRLGYASSLLLKGRTAGEAAAEAGFADQFYMTRCFLKQFGFAPTRIREIRKRLVA